MESQSNCPPNLLSVIQYLRSSSGPKTRIGVLNGKRVDYFKGSTAIQSILSPSYVKLSTKGKPNSPPAVKDEKEASELLHSVIPYAFFLRVDRAERVGKKGTPREVRINPQQLFKDDLHYVWFYEGSQIALKLGGLAMVVCMLAGVMFPLWPPIMRLGVWYLSMGVLGLVGLFFAIAIVRLIFWCITIVVLRPGIWIFPNLFEDVGFVDSFIPLWAWDVPPPSKKKKGGKKSARSEGGGGGNEKSQVGKQQAIANLPGAPERVQAPNKPQQAATSTPTSTTTATTTTTTTTNGNENGNADGQKGPPGATSASLDDLN